MGEYVLRFECALALGIRRASARFMVDSLILEIKTVQSKQLLLLLQFQRVRAIMGKED